MGVVFLAGFPLTLVVTIILARVMGPELYGDLTFVLALLTSLQLLPSSGLPKLLTREVAEYRQSRQWSYYLGAVRGAVFWVLMISGLVITLLWILLELLAEEVIGNFRSLILIVIVLIPIHGLNVARNGVVRGMGFPTLAVLPGQVLHPMCVALGIGSLAFLGKISLENVLWLHVLVGCLVFVIGLAILASVRPSLPSSLEPTYCWRKWLLALGPFVLIDLVNSLNSQAGVLLLGFFGQEESVAAFRVAERGAYLVAMPLILVNMVISQHLVTLHKQRDGERLEKLIRNSCRGACMLGLPIGAILVLFGDRILGLVFGGAYAELSYLPMVVLVLGQCFSALLGSVGLILDMTGFERITMRGLILGLVCNFTLAILLIPTFQATGMAVAATVGIIVTNTVLGFAVYRYLKIRPGVI